MLLRAREEDGNCESGLLLLFPTPGLGLVGITAQLGEAQGWEPVWGWGQDIWGVPSDPRQSPARGMLEKCSEEWGLR